MSAEALAVRESGTTGVAMLRRALLSYAGLCVGGLIALVPAASWSGYWSVFAWPWVILVFWPDRCWGGNLPVLWGGGALLVTMAAITGHLLIRPDPATARRRRICASLCGLALPLVVQLSFMLLYSVCRWESQFPSRP